MKYEGASLSGQVKSYTACLPRDQGMRVTLSGSLPSTGVDAEVSGWRGPRALGDPRSAGNDVILEEELSKYRSPNKSLI